jgi:hypothetical protein
MLFLLTLLGCPSPTPDDSGLSPLDADFEAALEGPAGGCADVWMYAANDDNTVALFFQVGGVVQDACAAAAPSTFTYTLPDATVELRVEQGSDLTLNECNDVMDETGPEVARTWTASAGTASLLVEPTNTEYCDSDTTPATLTLTDVTFTADDGAGDVVIESLVISANVGWLPG